MGLDKIVLIGHSMGGYLAAVYLMRYPQERFLISRLYRLYSIVTVAYIRKYLIQFLPNFLEQAKNNFSGKL